MSAYEWALLVFAALMVCILVWDTMRLRTRIDRIEMDIAWLKRAVHNTVRVHQDHLDRLAARVNELERRPYVTNLRVTPLDEEGKPVGSELRPTRSGMLLDRKSRSARLTPAGWSWDENSEHGKELRGDFEAGAAGGSEAGRGSADQHSDGSGCSGDGVVQD